MRAVQETRLLCAPLNSLGRAEPASLGNDHFSSNIMESLPQLVSLKLHLYNIFLFQTFAAVTVAADATARESSC